MERRWQAQTANCAFARPYLKEINDDLNSDIFKPYACEKADVDSSLLAEIIETLYFPKGRYRFDARDVEQVVYKQTMLI